MKELPIGCRVKIYPTHHLFRKWAGREGEIMQRETEEDELQYRVLLFEQRVLRDGSLSVYAPGEGYLFRRVELEACS